MRAVVILVALTAVSALSFAAGWGLNTGYDRRVRARRGGWTTTHHDIYKRSVNLIQRILSAQSLDLGMDPLLQRVSLTNSLREEAEGVVNDYRKEIDA